MIAVEAGGMSFFRGSQPTAIAHLFESSMIPQGNATFEFRWNIDQTKDENERSLYTRKRSGEFQALIMSSNASRLKLVMKK
jgi:hypothetical protein